LTGDLVAGFKRRAPAAVTGLPSSETTAAGLSAVDCAATIGELQLWNTVVTLDIKTSEIEAYFLADPMLPGVIINEGSVPIGILSRQSLLAAISQPFGREVFIKRPVREMIKSIDTAPLLLPATTPIAAALKHAMSRHDHIRFEPLLVRDERVVCLLDVPDLLTAQATLLEATLKAKENLIGQIELTAAELQTALDTKARLADQLSIARETAQHEATHDALTGLPNRKLFLDVLESAMAFMRAGPLRDCAVLFIDLDRFKLVNDSLGHEAGNELLKQVAARLGQIVRRPSSGGDGAPPADTVARLSGDEFAVLLTNKGPGAEAGVTRRLLAALARPFKIQGVTVHISASIGVLGSINQYQTTEAILRDADIAMYQAKRRGKARAETFEPAMRERVEQRLHIENSLRDAIVKEDFVLHYQPIVDLRSGKISGVEALLRWQSPAELVYPASFIGIAEETGLIVPLGNWVFRKVCEDGLDLQAAVAPTQHFAISINLSPLQFSQPELCETLTELVSLAGIDPGMLTLEITERSAMADPERALATLQRLKSIGFRLAIDDFGTGYSSLSYLHRFPVDVLKIDRSFVSHSGVSEDGTKIVAAILALARSLDMEVVAEGVETAFQRDWLQNLGCQFGQGFYFGRGVAKAEIPKALRGSVLVV